MNRAVTKAEFLVPDPWLTRTLGTNTFALRAPLPENVSVINRELKKAAGAARAFFFTKIPVAEAATVGVLQQLGFHLIETQVSFEHHETGSAVAAARFPVRRAEDRDRTQVLEIAGRSFKSSRFHRDPLIGQHAADQLKRQWAENCLNGERASEVLVAGAEDVVGFLAVTLAGKPDAPNAVIDLLAVDERHQGRGVGSSLVREFVGRWRPRASALLVGTQISNSSSLRLYEACGFRFREATYLLHAHWLDGRCA